MNMKNFNEYGKTVLIAGALASMGLIGLKQINVYVDLPSVVDKMQKKQTAIVASQESMRSTQTEHGKKLTTIVGMLKRMRR